MRLIDADALITDCQLAQKQADRHGREFASAFYSDGGEISTEWWCVEDMIENAPTVEPERKTGRWQEDPSGYGFWICSACGFVSEASGADLLYNFCPHCGADMRGEDK